MENITKIIKLPDGNQMKLALNSAFLEDDVDLNRLLFIDYQNLAAEIATFSIVFAAISFLRTDLNREVRKAELDLKIFKSKTKKAYREEMNDTKQKFTAEMPDDATRSTTEYKIFNLKHIESLFKYETMDSLYWSVKSKSDQLRALNMGHEEFTNQLLNTSVKEINYVSLRLIKPTIR